MNNKIEKQLNNYYISQELLNKFLRSNKIQLVLKFDSNLKFSDIKIIKTIIALELWSGNRPKLTATSWNDQLIITLKSKIALELISLLLNSNLILNNRVNLTTYLFPLALKATVNLNLVNHSLTKLELFVKSAYLD